MRRYLPLRAAWYCGGSNYSWFCYIAPWERKTLRYFAIRGMWRDFDENPACCGLNAKVGRVTDFWIYGKRNRLRCYLKWYLPNLLLNGFGKKWSRRWATIFRWQRRVLRKTNQVKVGRNLVFIFEVLFIIITGLDLLNLQFNGLGKKWNRRWATIFRWHRRVLRKTNQVKVGRNLVFIFEVLFIIVTGLDGMLNMIVETEKRCRIIK